MEIDDCNYDLAKSLIKEFSNFVTSAWRIHSIVAKLKNLNWLNILLLICKIPTQRKFLIKRLILNLLLSNKQNYKQGLNKIFILT